MPFSLYKSITSRLYRDQKISGTKHLKFFAIRGFPKSGTNWFNNLMNLHPQIFSSGEFAFSGFAEAREHLNQVATWTVCNSPGMKGKLDIAFEEMSKSLIIDHARLWSNVTEKAWLGDKTPSQAYPPVIKNSKCFYLIRDVRDVIVSRAYHLLRVNGLWALKDYPKMIEKANKYGNSLHHFREHPSQLLDDLSWVRDSAKAWSNHVGQVLGDDANTFKKQFPYYQIKIVKYEQLHTDVEMERSKCYQFLDLNPHEALPLDSGKNKTSPGFKIEDPQNFYRKGKIGDWRNYFGKDIEDIVLEEAEDMLCKSGYVE